MLAFLRQTFLQLDQSRSFLFFEIGSPGKTSSYSNSLSCPRLDFEHAEQRNTRYPETQFALPIQDDLSLVVPISRGSQSELIWSGKIVPARSANLDKAGNIRETALFFYSLRARLTKDSNLPFACIPAQARYQLQPHEVTIQSFHGSKPTTIKKPNNLHLSKSCHNSSIYLTPYQPRIACYRAELA